MRFNHMELTFPVGTLTKEFKEEVERVLRIDPRMVRCRRRGGRSAVSHPDARSRSVHPVG